MINQGEKSIINLVACYLDYYCSCSYLEKVGNERDALKQQLEAAKHQVSTLKRDYKILLAG